MMKTLIFLCLICLCSYKMRMPEDRLYQAGFRTVRFTDRSRIFKPNSDTANYLHYRPVDADIWYPAETTATDTAVHFKYFLDLYGSRANYYTASKAGDRIPSLFANGFCSAFKCSTPAQLFAYPTSSYKNAKPAAGKFPVVLYMASYGSMGYENYKLFEDLAKRGYLVVAITSTGRYPGEMTMKNEDMLEQADDAAAVLKQLQNDPQADFSKLALCGYSWGGVGNAILATRFSNVKCIISFEGSEFHHYGYDKNEDIDFNGIKNSSAFQQMKLRVPYFRLESSPLVKDIKRDSVFDFKQKLLGDQLILKVDSADHQDFCYLPVVVKSSGKCNTRGLYNTISALTVSYLDDHLKQTREFLSVREKLKNNKFIH